MKSNLDLIQVLENISEACFLLNSDWEYEYINKAAESFLKAVGPLSNKTKEDLIGIRIWDVLPNYVGTDTYKIFHKALEEQTLQTFDIVAEYSKISLEVKIFPSKDGLFVMFIDITKQKENEKLQQIHEKLKIIGEMAAGVAHEVRNPMTTVKGFLQLMAENEELERYKSIHNLMIDEINRVNDIITQFLDISKDKPNKIECCDLNELIKIILPLLETRAVKEGKPIALKLSSIPEIEVDKNEIRQILLNLINNALDAMDAGKTVEIITYEDNDAVVLSIKDEGPGIPADLIGDIETPFITSKEGGTGLGIPICFSIAKRNNATIDYTSSSEGTTFNVRFSTKLVLV